MNITINTTYRMFYLQLLELLSSFNPIKKLRKGERIVLAEIMYQHYKYRDLSETIRRNTIFSQEVRKEMGDHLNLPSSGLNNALSVLRRNNVLNKDNTLISSLYIFPKDSFIFNIEFKL